ncbi:MAG: hypothetical protein ACPG77_20250, partial [Nannocystaceae bacterium]
MDYRQIWRRETVRFKDRRNFINLIKAGSKHDQRDTLNIWQPSTGAGDTSSRDLKLARVCASLARISLFLDGNSRI